MTQQKYFLDLNYSLANEDTSLERSITQKLKPQRIISVCGSGSRSFPLLHPEVKELSLVDLSEQQLWLAELRLETIKKLSYQDYLLFWGYSPYKVVENNERRKEMYHAFEISLEAGNYLSSKFEENQWKSLLYTGKWEKTFILFSKVAKKVLGVKTIDKLFSFENLDEQIHYIQNEFPKLKWKFLLAIIGNKPLFNTLLYKGDFITKNVEDSHFQYYSKAYHHLFTHDLTRKSFFLQLCLLGEIQYASGNLIEADKNCFDEMKESVKNCKINFIKQDIITAVKEAKETDFVSLSNVPSYFKGDIEKSFLQDIKPGLNSGACVVFRNYLRVPEAYREGYQSINQQFENEIADEKVQMYRVEILKYES